VIRRAIGAAAIGNVTEWYVFGVYAYFRTNPWKSLLCGVERNRGTIAAFGLFAVAFLIRPLGGLFLGPLADRIGRNRVLAMTMVLMALGTFAIGLIPSERRIGIRAPSLLLVARLVQGFSTGGEYGNAMRFVAKYAPDRRPGFLGSWLEFGTFAGYPCSAPSWSPWPTPPSPKSSCAARGGQASVGLRYYRVGEQRRRAAVGATFLSAAKREHLPGVRAAEAAEVFGQRDARLCDLVGGPAEDEATVEQDVTGVGRDLTE